VQRRTRTTCGLVMQLLVSLIEEGEENGRPQSTEKLWVFSLFRSHLMPPLYSVAKLLISAVAPFVFPCELDWPNYVSRPSFPSLGLEGFSG